MLLIFAVLVVACVGSTVAVVPCSRYPDIVCKFKEFEECYEYAEPPVRQVNYDTKYTMKYAPSEVVEDLGCVIAFQKPGFVYVYSYLANNSYTVQTFPQQVKSYYISEQDSNGTEGTVYTIQSKNHVLLNYKCIETEGVEGSGVPMIVIWVECGFQNDWRTKEQVDIALKCVEKLNLTEVVEVTPCKCDCDCLL